MVSMTSILEFVRPTTIPAKVIENAEDTTLTLGFTEEEEPHFVPLFVTIVEHQKDAACVNLSPSGDQVLSLSPSLFALY